MNKGIYIILLSVTFVAGCSLFNRDKPVTLEAPFSDYRMYLNAELIPFSGGSGRYIHFEDTRYILSFSIDCQTLPVDSVHQAKLLRIPIGVNIEDWIRYHHADFINEYTDIEPYDYDLLSGEIQLNNTRTEGEQRKYGDQQITVRVFYYQLQANELSFEGNTTIPSLQLEEHRCFSTDDL